MGIAIVVGIFCFTSISALLIDSWMGVRRRKRVEKAEKIKSQIHFFIFSFQLKCNKLSPNVYDQNQAFLDQPVTSDHKEIYSLAQEYYEKEEYKQILW